MRAIIAVLVESHVKRAGESVSSGSRIGMTAVPVAWQELVLTQSMVTHDLYPFDLPERRGG